MFDKAVADLARPAPRSSIRSSFPDLKALLATRPGASRTTTPCTNCYFTGGKAPFRHARPAMASPLFEKVVNSGHAAGRRRQPERQHRYMRARETLMTNMLKVMADHRLDAIVHKAVEHTPTLIKDGVNPPFVDQKGAPHINTFLMFVPSIVVPAGFTRDDLPAGITFLGRPYDDARMIQLAYAYEQASLIGAHRLPRRSSEGEGFRGCR